MRLEPSSTGLPDSVVDHWPGLTLLEQIDEGNRNLVWRADLDGRAVAVRRSRRSPSSLDWELDLVQLLDQRGFIVPVTIPTVDGARSHDTLVVQEWIHGRPPEAENDWVLVAAELRRLHVTCGDVIQRPDCMSVTELGRSSSSVDADMAALPTDVAERVLQVFTKFRDVPQAVIHGDPAPSNIRLTDDGRVGLLDWDESRVDLVWHDLSNLGTQVLDGADHERAERLSNAWEAANAWAVEPEYARQRLAALTRDAGRTGLAAEQPE